MPWNLYLSPLKSAWDPLAVLSHLVGPGGRLVGLAALGALVGVRIISLRSVMMTVREAPVRAESHATEGTRVVVLAAAHGAAPPDVRPGRRDLAAVAAVQVRIEAHVLG